MIEKLQKLIFSLSPQIFQVLKFSSGDAGLVLLTGQLADGASTTLVGLVADRVARVLPVCARLV